MADETMNQENEELFDEIYTLTDDEGKEADFKLLASCELEGVEYYALIPLT